MMSFKPGKIFKRLYSIITLATTRSSEIAQKSLIDTFQRKIFITYFLNRCLHANLIAQCTTMYLGNHSENLFLRFDELFLQDDEDTISELIGDQKKIRDKIFKNIISKVCF